MRKSIAPKNLAYFAILLGLLLCFAWKPFRIYQHRQSLERAYEMIQADNDIEIDGIRHQQTYSAWEVLIAEFGGLSTNPGDRYDYHLNALVELEYFVKREFRFQHIQGGTPERRRLWQLACSKKNLANKHTTGTTCAEFYCITVWDRPDKIPQWEAFVEKHDVPDFRQRYLEPEPDVQTAE